MIPENSNSDVVEKLNKQILIPKRLTAEDGREFKIKSWKPFVSDGPMITVEVVLLIDKRSVEK